VQVHNCFTMSGAVTTGSSRASQRARAKVTVTAVSFIGIICMQQNSELITKYRQITNT